MRRLFVTLVVLFGSLLHAAPAAQGLTETEAKTTKEVVDVLSALGQSGAVMVDGRPQLSQEAATTLLNLVQMCQISEIVMALLPWVVIALLIEAILRYLKLDCTAAIFRSIAFLGVMFIPIPFFTYTGLLGVLLSVPFIFVIRYRRLQKSGTRPAPKK